MPLHWDRIVRCQPPGVLVAEVLTGAWRQAPPPLQLRPEALAAAVPLLLQSTAAPLGWHRLRAAGLHTARPARALQHAYRLQVLQAATHEQHLQEVVTFLRATGVEPVLVKGWSVSRLYPETSLRPYGDLDLCVRHDQAAAAMTALTRAGRRQWLVELHRGISDLKDRTWDEAWRRSRLARLGDVEVRVLGPEDQLRLLCLHLMRHGACAPLWLCDLGAALEARPADFDWDYCLHGHPSRSAWILCLLGLAQQLLGARFDEPALAARTDVPPWLAPAVVARWAGPVRDSSLLDPLKSAYRRRLRPGLGRRAVLLLGLLGRLAEVPARLRRQVRRWRCPPGRPFELHDELGG
jgi:hypothetical protein